MGRSTTVRAEPVEARLPSLRRTLRQAQGERIFLRTFPITGREKARNVASLSRTRHNLEEMDKQQILDEIRRTANENGGKPLGRQKFYGETGIKESDWLGKFWIRWNDALAEAGLSPNTMQLAIPEDVLVEKLIGFMREIDHFPLHAELRMKARHDPNFPSHNTFSSRLGKKAEVAAAIYNYCQGRSGYDDVMALCKPIIGETSSSDSEDDASDETTGFVYLMKSGRYYKIGRSNAPGRREYDLSIQLPEKIKTVHTIRTDDPVGIEAYWHKRFADRRKNGEWFVLSASDIKAFRRRKFM